MDMLDKSPDGVSQEFFDSVRAHFGGVFNFYSYRDTSAVAGFVRKLNEDYYNSKRSYKNWLSVALVTLLLIGVLLCSTVLSNRNVSPWEALVCGIAALLMVLVYLFRVNVWLPWNAYSATGSMSTEKLPEIFEDELRARMAAFLSKNPSVQVSSVSAIGPESRALFVRVAEKSYVYHDSRWLTVFLDADMVAAELAASTPHQRELSNALAHG